MVGGEAVTGRPSRDKHYIEMATLISRRSTCHRLAVGCVLVDFRGHVLSTGYNGRASGLPHCNEERNDYPPFNPFKCPNSDKPSGEPNGCEAIHAEQNALLQCRDVYAIETCYATHSPCLVCVKLLMNTSCQQIIFVNEYPHPDARQLWASAGRGVFGVLSE
jgi:dCMP deaminase